MRNVARIEDRLQAQAADSSVGVWNRGDGLRVELAPRVVDVLAVAPGPGREAASASCPYSNVGRVIAGMRNGQAGPRTRVR